MSDNQFTSPAFVKTDGLPPSDPGSDRQWICLRVDAPGVAKTTFRLLCKATTTISMTTDSGEVLLRAVVNTAVQPKPAPNFCEEEE